MADQGKTIAALLIGLAAGATLGMLFAPEKGSTTRKKLFKMADDLAGEAEDKLDEGSEYLKSKMSEGKERASQLVDKIHGKASDLKDKADEVKDKVKSDMEDARNKARQQSF